MKKVLILFAALNLVLFGALGSLFLLSDSHPLRPGSAVYGLQDLAEQWRLRLSSGEDRRAEVALDLVERRLDDLAQAGAQPHLQAAASAFNAATDQAIRRIDAAPTSTQDGLYTRLRAVLDRAEVLVSALDQHDLATSVARLARRIAALQAAETSEQMLALLPPVSTLSRAEPIPFLGNDVDHSAYPLLGAHAEVACVDCHLDGLYAETPTDCDACHLLPVDGTYPSHFAGACDDCHGLDSWAALSFDHAGVTECTSCHREDNPEGHYARADGAWRLAAQLGDPALQSVSDPCASCHYNLSDWDQAAFDHFGSSMPCQSCHPSEDPYDHPYDGACLDCHGTADWQAIDYDHQAVTECRSCHLRDTPQNHYLAAKNTLWYVAWLPASQPREQTSPTAVQQCPATCANCHEDTADWQDVAFDHADFPDCQSCHLADDTPIDHYDGQCSRCHTATNWAAVDFDHTDYQDCQSCHAGDDTPTGHYPGQCSACHDTEDWQYTGFDHTGTGADGDCQSCHDALAPNDHYAGTCDRCHATEVWTLVRFDHDGYDDCLACHGAIDHYRGQCSSCHNTDSWASAWFNHSGHSACQNCHRDDLPAAHYDGPCASCHSTATWAEPSIDHSGLASCDGCHAAPTDHYPASCAQCHDLTAWEAVQVDHTDLTVCLDCHTPPEPDHYSDECADCHNVARWRDVLYDHSDVGDCTECHTAPENHYPGECLNCHCTCDWLEKHFEHDPVRDDDCASCHPTPAGHWPGQCSDCHNTGEWGDYTFNHNGYTNCNACHAQDRPAGHPRGQCSKCHTTDTWVISTETPTPEPTTAETAAAPLATEPASRLLPTDSPLEPIGAPPIATPPPDATIETPAPAPATPPPEPTPVPTPFSRSGLPTP